MLSSVSGMHAVQQEIKLSRVFLGLMKKSEIMFGNGSTNFK